MKRRIVVGLVGLLRPIGCDEEEARCGDGEVNEGEECDDGGFSIGCTSACKLVLGCGNGRLDDGVATTRYLLVVDALVDTAAQYAIGMFCP